MFRGLGLNIRRLGLRVLGCRMLGFNVSGIVFEGLGCIEIHGARCKSKGACVGIKQSNVEASIIGSIYYWDRLLIDLYATKPYSNHIRALDSRAEPILL